MVLSLTILGIVTVSVGSVALLAGQSEPQDDSAAATLVTDSRTLARIAEDLAMARYMIEQGPNAVTIVVADRTGDGLPDRLRYAWSGGAATPLTVQLNDQSPVTVIKYVDQFELTYDRDQRVTTTPGAPGEAGSEVLLAAFETVSGGTNVNINANNAGGQLITPTLSDGATAFQPTRLEVYSRANANTDGVTNVELRDVDRSAPGTALYAQASLDESTMSSAFDWTSVDLTLAEAVPAGQQVALSFVYDSGTGRAARLLANTQANDGRLISSDGGSSWSLDTNSSLCYRLYGREVAGGASGYDITREHVGGITIALQSTAEGRSPIRRTARLEQAPEMLTDFWEADFYASPTNHDLNNDGSADWVFNNGSGDIPAALLNKGVWSTQRPLRINPAPALPDVVRVKARLCSDTGQTVSVYGPFHTDGGGNVLPLVAVLQESAGSQELLVYNQQNPTSPIATITGLGAGWVDAQFTLLPKEQVVHLVVNGEDRGTAQLQWETDQGARGFWVEGTGSGAKAIQLHVTLGGSIVANADAPAQALGGETRSAEVKR